MCRTGRRTASEHRRYSDGELPEPHAKSTQGPILVAASPPYGAPLPTFFPTWPWRSVALRDPVWQLAPPRRKFSSVIQRRFRPPPLPGQCSSAEPVIHFFVQPGNGVAAVPRPLEVCDDHV